ncbi:MAG: hypothetical protein ACRDNZ_23285 [Streptosporangiaceae bacterium]
MARFSRLRPRRAQRADRGRTPGRVPGQAAEERQVQTAQTGPDMGSAQEREPGGEAGGHGEGELRTAAALASAERLIAAQAQQQRARELSQAAWDAKHAAYDSDVRSEAAAALQAAGRAEFLAWQEMVVAKVKFQTARADADRDAWQSSGAQEAGPREPAAAGPEPYLEAGS